MTHTHPPRWTDDRIDALIIEAYRLVLRLTPDIIDAEMHRLRCSEDVAVATLADAEARSVLARVLGSDHTGAEAA